MHGTAVLVASRCIIKSASGSGAQARLGEKEQVDYSHAMVHKWVHQGLALGSEAPLMMPNIVLFLFSVQVDAASRRKLCTLWHIWIPPLAVAWWVFETPFCKTRPALQNGLLEWRMQQFLHARQTQVASHTTKMRKHMCVSSLTRRIWISSEEFLANNCTPNVFVAALDSHLRATHPSKARL